MLHANSDLQMKFRKRRLENALLTEQIERQVLFFLTVTSWLLHDDAKIHATMARLYNVFGKLAGDEKFRPK